MFLMNVQYFNVTYCVEFKFIVLYIYLMMVFFEFVFYLYILLIEIHFNFCRVIFVILKIP